MTPASITERPTQRTTRRRKPAPEAIYQTYTYECQHVGERRAASATAARYGVSDDTVRRVVQRMRDREQEREATPADLQYTAPPMGYPEPQPAAILPQIVLDYAAKAPHAQPQPSVFEERPVTSSSDADAVQSAAVDQAATVEEPQSEEPQTRTAEPADTTPATPARSDLAPAIDPYRAAARAAALQAYRRRVEADEAAQRRRQGLMVRIAHSDYAGFWIGVLVFVALLAVMVWT